MSVRPLITITTLKLYLCQMLARTLLFQINIVMNLLNSDSRDAFGEVDLDEISASVCDTLRKLRLAVMTEVRS